ncbi:hypothetical protein RHS01_03564 [Rhizoctonia solani]|uniref:Uncharacterized protein n=1 Tax=Rhizoctonia solani TaxID=456999 RepID=A0A8H7IHZ1_9AGAM|nr:hypothetical protein RHS01_03564 [Rhizoctonia solani]
MDKLKMPEYKFGPKVPWSRLVVTNVPTGMGGPAQRMRNRDKLTQLLRDLFPEEAKFGNLKITLAPDWLADPARLQAEGRQASTVSFAFEDAGASPQTVYSLTHKLFIYGRQCKIKKFTQTPTTSMLKMRKVQTHQAPMPHKEARCHKCGRNNHSPNNITLTTALDAPKTERVTHANAYTAHCAAARTLIQHP